MDYTIDNFKLAKLTINKREKWIQQNYEYFLEKLQQIKEAYLSYNGELIFGTKYVQIKENILLLKINFKIYHLKMFDLLIADIFKLLKISTPDKNDIIKSYMSIGLDLKKKKLKISKKNFIKGFFVLISPKINNFTLKKK